MNRDADLLDRRLGGLYGLLIGDALGVPYEFNEPEGLPSLESLGYQPPAGFKSTYPNIAPGTWSDDGAQALCLLESLLKHQGRLDLEDFAQSLWAWYQQGHMAVDRLVFDVGIQSAQSLQLLSDGHPASQCGGTHERSNGNGSLMRVLPLVLLHRGSDTELIERAHQQSLVTHAHARSQMCCALYCLWAWYELQRTAEPWATAVQTLETYYATKPLLKDHLHEFQQCIQPVALKSLNRSDCTGTGYVVDSLHSARWACQSGDFLDVIRRAISLGHDTDTTACIAGGIAGIRCGLSGLPKDLVSGLRGQEQWLMPLFEGIREAFL